MNDHAARAAAINGAAKAIQWEVGQRWDASRTDVPEFRERIAAILDNCLPTEFTEAVMQARADHLENVLAKVRAECERLLNDDDPHFSPSFKTGRASAARNVLDVMNESDEP